MSDPDRIFLEPEHDELEGRLWCQDDDPASLGEPWTEYVRADLYATRAAELANMREEREDRIVALVESARRIATLTADRNEWMVKANAATALASQYLRERDRYRSELENIANADQSTWDEEMQEPIEFKRWAQSRAHRALNREEHDEHD